MSRESQKNYQDQMNALVERGHEDSIAITKALTELCVEVRTLNKLNGASK